MEDFIKTHISKINKNNILNINIGKIMDENIFNKKINANTIDNFLDKLSIINSKTYLSKYYTQKIYKHKNNIIKVSKTKTYYSYKESIVKIVKKTPFDLSLSICEIDNNITGPISVLKYHSIELKDILNIDFNLFNIVISKFDKYFTFSINIKKPNNYSKIISTINEILQIFM